MSAPVVVTDLRCRRGAFQLGPLSFAVAAGGRLAVVGPSGSGKTTLLRTLAGLDRADGGTVQVGGTVVTGDRVHVPPDRRGLGLVFQEGALWPHMTALQHLRFAAPALTVAEAKALLARAGIGHLADRRPAAMSGGEAQRLGLLRALAPEPGVLLLDEPLRSVDVHLRDALVLLVRGLADERGLTTILVTHDRDEALALATDLVVLHEGHLVERGAASDLLANPATAFTAAFLGGAACLPATVTDGAADTPLGRFPLPTAGHGGTTDGLRLVLLPGEATATAAPAGGAATGRVLQALPTADGAMLRIGFGDQIVLARAPRLEPAGAVVRLALTGPPRLLPWRTETPA